MATLTVYPLEKPLAGTITVPGDKSISHRALILGSLAEGTTTIHNLLEADDVKRTMTALRDLGVSIYKRGSVWKVKGVGFKGFKKPGHVLYCGNSGTTLRLLTGLLSAQPFESQLTGDASLNSRPMKRLIDPLTKMGACVKEVGEGGEKIIHIEGRPLKGAHHKIPVASSQLKSALLLAGLYAEGETKVTEPYQSRDHTERMFQEFGIPLIQDKLSVTLKGSRRLTKTTIKVPGDFSSAAYFIIAALIQVALFKEAKVTIKGVGINPTRIGMMKVLREMGARISLSNQKVVNGEPIANLTIEPSDLGAVQVDDELVPSLIDEIPVLSIAAAFAQGVSEVQGAHELRLKESDRIKTISEQLGWLGVDITQYEDGFKIVGHKTRLKSCKMNSFLDHRIAMSLAIAGLMSENGVEISAAEAIQISFPTFIPILRSLGVKLSQSRSGFKCLKEKRKAFDKQKGP